MTIPDETLRELGLPTPEEPPPMREYKLRRVQPTKSDLLQACESAVRLLEQGQPARALRTLRAAMGDG